MRIATILKDGLPQVAMETEQGFLPFGDFGPGDSGPRDTIELIQNWSQYKDSDKDKALLDSATTTSQTISKEGVTRIAPITNPEKIICIGKNYAMHAAEMGSEPPSIPVVFSKFNSAIANPDADISLPAISDKVDFEAELVVVIGKEGRFIDRTDAMNHVFGYCCGNDISARDWQKEKPGGQWLLGKTFDSFAPLGPCLVTADAIADPHGLDISLRLNGETMQQSNTSRLIFRIDFLISHLSQFVTLKPGDLIFTGTPAGVGAGRKPPLFLKPGDQIEIEIEGIGKLANQIVSC